MAPAADAESIKCHLLSVPTEIRNYIYDLVFTSDTTVNLLQAKAPPKAVTGTCRQIFQEARLVYRAAYRQFWRASQFAITLNAPGRNDHQDVRTKYSTTVYRQLYGLSADNVRNIGQLRIIHRHVTCLWEDDVWFTFDQAHQEEPDGILVPSRHVQTFCDAGHHVRDVDFNRSFKRVDLHHSNVGFQPAKGILKGQKMTLQELKSAVAYALDL